MATNAPFIAVDAHAWAGMIAHCESCGAVKDSARRGPCPKPAQGAACLNTGTHHHWKAGSTDTEFTCLRCGRSAIFYDPAASSADPELQESDVLRYVEFAASGRAER